MTHTNAAALISYVDEVYPNSVSASLKCTYLNDTLKSIKQYIMTTEYTPSSTTSTGFMVLTSGQEFYSLPGEIDISDIKQFYVKTTKGGTFATSDSYTEYTYAGKDDSKEDGCYFEGTTEGKFGVYPVPTSDDTNRLMRLRYQVSPIVYTTANSTVSFTVHPDYEELIKVRLIEKVAKTGDFPDIDMANNWTYESKELDRRIKLQSYHRRKQQGSGKVSYKDWSW